MNMDGVGERLIDELVNKGLVRRWSDLYLLTAEQLLSLDRKAEKSVQKLLTAIEASRKPKLDRFIFALGIRFVGESTARSLARAYQSLSAFMSATPDSLLAISDIGPKVSASILAALNSSEFRASVQALLDAGVQVDESARSRPSGDGAVESDGHSTEEQPFAKMTFVVTGTLPVAREVAQNWIIDRGGKVAGSVSKKTHFVVVGADAGSKLEKAIALGIPTISWEQLQALPKQGQ